MRIQFLGAAGTVTGSKHLVTAGGTKILIDCGMYQGLKHLRLRNREGLPVDPQEIDAVVLTHAHLDHSGYLPVLVRNGFSGPVYASHGTRSLSEILLPDSGRIQEEDTAYATRKGHSRHDRPHPLFTERDARAALSRFRGVKQGVPFEIGCVRISMVSAGHILGASMVQVEAEGNSVLFSGDIGRFRDPIMKAPTLPGEHDLIVMESTYGHREHPADDILEVLGEILQRTFSRGGVVLIPAFAVGRCQSILYWLWRLFESGRVQRVPVYLNSPMAREVTRVYEIHSAEHRLGRDASRTVFRLPRVVNTPEESRALNRKHEPMVIISAAGMLTGGRVLHHLKAFGPHAENTIVLPGFQAAGTRGADLVRGEREIKVHGQFLSIQAEVVSMPSLSAHADRSELVVWLECAKRPPGQVRLVHGEPHAAEALRQAIAARLGLDVRVAEDGEVVDLPVVETVGA
jgi:metallo-beta-lactamase family protein